MIKDQDYEGYDCLIWLPIDCIIHTLSTTTQRLWNAYHIQVRKHLKSCFPAAMSLLKMNLSPLTLCSLGNNGTAVEIFIGCNSKHVDVYGVTTNCNLSCRLEENISDQEAMAVLISNNAHAATSQNVKDFLCMYCINFYNSEPHHTKTMANAVLGTSKMSQTLY